VFSVCAQAQQEEQTIELADVAYDQFDLKKSHQILETILSKDSLQNEQKCEVLQKLAHQDWKYYQDYTLAKRRLLKADSIGNLKYKTWILLSRIERESQHFKEALHSATKAKNFAKSESEMVEAIVAYASAAYNFSKDQLEQGVIMDQYLLAKASQLISHVLETNAGTPAPSRLLLGISLLNNDGAGVLKAWKSYFQIQDIDRAYPYLSSPAKKLSRICKNWNGNKLTIPDQEELIDALASSRFYTFIPVYVKKHDREFAYDQKIKDAIIYSRYLKDIEKKTNSYYRLISIGQENETVYMEWLTNKRKELWDTLSLTKLKEYNEPDFLDAMEKHFGARGFTGSTGNYNGYVLCLGHIVNQEIAKIEQYGYQPEFTYTQLDMMVSNGFSSWFWEDKAIGGWATDHEIIRVREVYLNGPMKAWKMITDVTERRKVEETIRTFLNNSVASQLELSEGLAVKLRFDALINLYDRLAIGLSGQELKLAFLSKYEKYRVEASLLAHEGRHSIEQKYMAEEFKTWSNEEREFRAKLSQIVFASEPRLELAEMVTSVTGDFGHFRANKRIVDVVVKWIKENHPSISGYSSKTSAFSQIHLLKIHQIKECFKQADPLNK